IDHPASPKFIRGALVTMGDAFEKVGLSGGLCSEVSDGNCMHGALLGVGEPGSRVPEERVAALGGRNGAHVSFQLSYQSLWVGYARVQQMGKRVALGTDGIGADMFEEAKFAWFKARDGRNGLGIGDVVRFLTGAQSLASVLLGTRLGVLDVGYAADLVVLDYP